MDHRTRLEFQINRLGYQFKNVDLLQEALTHTLDTTNTLFSLQNRNFEKLTVIGNAVLKFIISQYVIQISDVKCPKENLAKMKDQLIHASVQKMVGMKLLEPFIPEAGPYQFMRVGSASRLNFDRSNKTGAGIPHEKFVVSLMGAVYLDAGGIEGNGTDLASKVFTKIWGNVQVPNKCIQASFPKPNRGVIKFWEANQVNAGFIAQIQNGIGVTLSESASLLLAEAVSQKTIYDEMDKNFGEGLDHQQRLQFLGDSVLGLIVTEIILLENPSSGSGGLNAQVTKRIESSGLLSVFDKLGLPQFVKMKTGGISEWNNGDDIVKSIVGALFVGGGGLAAMRFIKNTWDFTHEPVSQPSLEDLESKLGYKFKNIGFLIRALTHPSVVSGPALQSKHFKNNHPIPVDGRPALSYFGKSWIKFHVSDYVLHSCFQNESPESLESRRDYLCSQQVIQTIGHNLQLFKYFRVATGMVPFVFYENILYSICGAIFKDMQEAQLKMSFGTVFYRLWNPFFPSIFQAKRLIDNIPQSWRSPLRDQELEKIEKTLCHTFNYPWLMGHTRIGDDRSRYIGDGSMFSFIGQAVLDLAVSAYVTIACFMELQRGDVTRALDPQVLHSNTLLDCMEFGLEFFQAVHLHQIIHFPLVVENGRTRSATSPEIMKCLFGAVYFDMSASEENDADAIFSVWKEYFISTCAFVVDNRDRDED